MIVLIQKNNISVSIHLTMHDSILNQCNSFRASSKAHGEKQPHIQSYACALISTQVIRRPPHKLLVAFLMYVYIYIQPSSKTCESVSSIHACLQARYFSWIGSFSGAKRNCANRNKWWKCVSICDNTRLIIVGKSSYFL